jgi:cyclase
MFTPRIIPVLLIKSGILVKSKKFSNYRYIGDPINAARIFNESLADELVILDTTATSECRGPNLSLASQLTSETSMPCTYGGGISNQRDIEKLLRIGVEKVVICSAAYHNPSFIRDAVNSFGSSTICVCVDVKKTLFGNYKIYSHSERKIVPGNLIEAIGILEDAGAGEIIIQSVDKDGTQGGYDTNLYKAISLNSKCPIVALGGARDFDDIVHNWNNTSVNAFAAGSMFVFYGPLKGVLVNYSRINKDAFRKKFSV